MSTKHSMTYMTFFLENYLEKNKKIRRDNNKNNIQIHIHIHIQSPFTDSYLQNPSVNNSGGVHSEVFVIVFYIACPNLQNFFVIESRTGKGGMLCLRLSII